MIVFFDLPMESLEEKREYRHFRKTLIKNGFIMLQESVYVKLLTAPSVEQSIRNLLQKNKPSSGLVQTLMVTEKQFSKMDFIVGKFLNDVIDTDESLIIL